MKLIHIFIALFIFGFAAAQEEIKIFSKYFIKEGKVIFRIIPGNLKSFEAIKSGSLQVLRSENNSGIFQKEIVLIETLKPFASRDIINWNKILKKDMNKGAFVYQVLHNNAPDPKLNATQRDLNHKMVYDMLLLSCDFDSDIAKACGLYFQDSSNNNETLYQYKITHIAPNGKTQTLAKIKVDPSVISSNVNITGLTGKAKNKITTLKWNAKKYSSEYSGFNIERSEDSIHYKKINAAPAILFSTQFEKNKEFIFYQDTMPISHRKYFYRIRGINFFGEESSPSNVISMYSAPVTKSIPFLDSVIVIKNKAVLLKWTMLDKLENLSVKRFILLKSEKDKGIYNLIYGGTALEHLDSNPSNTNFYKVGAITFNDDTLYSYSKNAVIIDTIPPQVPTMLNSFCDSMGVVIIRWRKNREKDLQGYKLFRSNSLNEEFVQVNTKFINDTFYTDKLNLKTLSRKVFYFVTASDNNFNCSEKSAVITVERPDTIPPPKPILKSAVSDLKGIILEFVLGNENDVSDHLIYRKNKEDPEFKILHFIPGDSMENYTDTSVLHGHTYAYQIVAKDSSGNFSASNSVCVKYETGFREKLTNFKYTVDRQLKNIVLSWNYPKHAVERFILYRRKDGEQPSVLKTVEGNIFIYKDSTPFIGNVYEYRIKAVLVSGAESIISDPLKINY